MEPRTCAAHALSELLPENAIRVSVPAADWREAVAACGQALTASGAATGAYTAEMISTVEQLGPYIVIAPGIALAHARPSPAVLRAGMSVVTLAQPVAFGHATNDPVSLVVGLAAPDDQGHIAALAALAEFLVDDERRAALLASTSPGEIRRLIDVYEESQASPG